MKVSNKKKIACAQLFDRNLNIFIKKINKGENINNLFKS